MRWLQLRFDFDCTHIIRRDPTSDDSRTVERPSNRSRIAALILRKILDCTGGDIYGKRGARAYNGGLGGRAPSGVQGQRPWSGGQGAKPCWRWQHFSVWTLEESGKFAFCRYFATSVHYTTVV